MPMGDQDGRQSNAAIKRGVSLSQHWPTSVVFDPDLSLASCENSTTIQ
jgi:hypothetical protein